MQQWIGKLAVVTGASAGIGAAIVKDLAKAGITVVALARREDRLEDLKNELKDSPGKVHTMKIDVSKPTLVKEAFKEIEKNHGCVNILINNAGIIRKTSMLAENNENDLIDVINTNFLGMIMCAKESYNLMRKYDADGQIININSIMGHSVPFQYGVKPRYNLYPSTKHAMRAATEVIRQELNYIKNKKVKISNVSPGLVFTEIAAAVGLPDEVISSQPHIETKDVSNAVLYILSQPKNVQVHDIILKPIGESI